MLTTVAVLVVALATITFVVVNSWPDERSRRETRDASARMKSHAQRSAPDAPSDSPRGREPSDREQ
jgi:hypothetical protein